MPTTALIDRVVHRPGWPGRISAADFSSPGSGYPAPHPWVCGEIVDLAAAIGQARAAGKPVIVFLGAHPIKLGLSRYLIDLVAQGVIAHLAFTGATLLHDWEIGRRGTTSEDVDEALQDGTFGMSTDAADLGERLVGASLSTTLGQHFGGLLLDEGCLHPDLSLLVTAACTALPCTVHSMFGVDVWHLTPRFPPQTFGLLMWREFCTFVGAVDALHDGGVFVNIGSAIAGPELFLKALAVARNVSGGHAPRRFMTAVLDCYPVPPGWRDGIHGAFVHQRSFKNVLVRPRLPDRPGLYIMGPFQSTIPALHAAVMQSEGEMTATRRKKEPATVPVADSMAKLAEFNIAGKQIVLLEYIRHRAAGLRMSFDEWVDLQVQLREGEKITSPSRMLAGYAASYGLSEDVQTDLLQVYIETLEAQPDLSFGDYLAACFPAESDVQAKDELTAPEPEPEPEPEPKPESAKTRTRRKPAAKKDATKSLLDHRVVYKNTNGNVIYAICTADDGNLVDIMDDWGDSWSKIRRELVREDDRPVTWTITSKEDELIKEMLRPGRGPWSEAEADEVLFEVARRVSRDKLIVVTVHNGQPQPFVDAYVFDESTDEVPFEHRPPAAFVSEYSFDVPGVGTIPARVVVI